MTHTRPGYVRRRVGIRAQWKARFQVSDTYSTLPSHYFSCFTTEIFGYINFSSRSRVLFEICASRSLIILIIERFQGFFPCFDYFYLYVIISIFVTFLITSIGRVIYSISRKKHHSRARIIFGHHF